MKNIQSQKNRAPFKYETIVLFAFLIFFTAPMWALPLKNNNPTTDLPTDQQVQNSSKDSVYSFVDKMPEYPGGEKEVVKFLSQTMRYPEEALKNGHFGKVVVRFVISKTGKVENATVVRSVSPELDAEALRVIGLLPDWTPGEQNGEKVAVYRIIPILFQKISPEDAWQVNEKTVVVIDNVKMPAPFNSNVLNLNQFSTVKVLKPFPEKEKSRIMSKYGKTAENGVILLTTNKNNIQYSFPDSTFTTLKNEYPACNEEATLPTFPGGETSMLKYIADSIQYPFVAKRLKTQGKVMVRFTVDTNGKVANIVPIRNGDYFLSKEAVRVISTMPDWIPGGQCGKILNFVVTVPVNFKLDLPVQEKKEWEKNDKTIVLLDGVRLPASFQLGWLRYENLTSYKVLPPTTKEEIKKLKSQYGRDAEYGVIVITSKK